MCCRVEGLEVQGHGFMVKGVEFASTTPNPRILNPNLRGFMQILDTDNANPAPSAQKSVGMRWGSGSSLIEFTVYDFVL